MTQVVAPEALFIARRLVRAARICESSDISSRSRAGLDVVAGLRDLIAPDFALPRLGRLGYVVDAGRVSLNGE